MRIVGILTLFMAAGTAMTPAGAAQTQEDFWESKDRTFFLHLAQYCERGVSLIRWIDEFDWPNDLDGCGGQIQQPDNKWTDVFPGFVPLYANVTAGTTAEMHIFVLSRAVDQTTVEATLDLGYATCAGTDGPEILMQEKVGGFHEFVIPCTFEVTGPAEPQTRPNLTIVVTATHTYGYGVEGDHASYFKLVGLDPAPPAETVELFSAGERPVVKFEEDKIILAELPAASDSAAKSPGLGLLATLAMIATGISLRIRRRL